ncbi:MAG: tyrosinase family protein [Candidatus Eremiobacteraeota bacterium]|nr:tyrosinase family protein [Candidatus Eremiobacteraeota bacterium]
MSAAPESAPPITRYRHVLDVMDDAQGAANPNYDGTPRFWHLPLEELRSFELYGVPMFGDAPGLVRGLRGEFPFDGTQFPRLPWGGTAVSDADIAIIERWIADGAPAEDEPAHDAPSAPEVAKLEALANGDAEHPEHDGPVNALAGDEPGRLRQRKNIAFLTDEELARYRAAIARMKSLDGHFRDERGFAYWGRIHANQCQHGWEEFLTWHRAYLYFFELVLSDIDNTVTLPYWDWAADTGDDGKPIIDPTIASGVDNGVVPLAFRCWIDAAAVARLKAGGAVPSDVLDKLSAMVGKPPSNSGARFFAASDIKYGEDLASDAAIKAELAHLNSLFHWNRWPGASNSLVLTSYPSPGDVKRITQIPSFFAFGSGPSNDRYFGALENIHNFMHTFSGGINPNFGVVPDEPKIGDMQDSGVTAFDPIFWGHHANVDRIWAEWQGQNATGLPDDPNDVLAPWNMRVADTSTITKLGYEYIMDSHLFKTDNDTPLVRFRSQSVAVHPAVLARHRRAEIRIHAVQHVARGGYHIRAFLNTPDASVDTPTRDNDRYVGQVSMFTGLCIGGPGHCAVPQLRTRPFDLRKEHHKLPSNFRIDATDAVAKLAAGGTTEFHVNLVVLNTDGTPATDALFANGVSLNFID